MAKRIAVIGAGASGMTATKQCLDQGLEVVVFEKTSYTGGLWRFQESVDVENGVASVMASTIINTSKEMSAFSDCPPPEEYPNFMHNSKQVAYLDMYSKRFNFTSYVRFRTEILSLELADDYESTGRWKVRSRHCETLEETLELFDGVMICTGHHGTVNQPNFPGQETFKGQILHTHSLKSGKGFDDQVVVVVGIGNSGGDAAVEISTVAKQVYLSTRRGAWVSRRVGERGLPSDTYFHRRSSWILLKYLPEWYTLSRHESALNQVFDHEVYQLKPAHRVNQQHIMVNDSLPNRILSGTIAVKGDIDHFTEDGLVFKGEDHVTPCDTVILATGYKVVFPFLSEAILPVNRNKVRLYKHMFVHSLKHAHTLALIGLVQPIGPLLPVSELQSRWFALLNAGKVTLPSVEEMERDVKRKEAQLSARYYESQRHTFEEDWLPFLDEIAGQIGVTPPLWKYALTDTKLFKALLWGPSASYQFRLVGPNAWSGAREAILTVEQRILAPLHTNSARGKPEGSKAGCSGIGKFALTLGLSSLLYLTLIKPCPALSARISDLTTYIQFDLLQKFY